MMMSHIFTTGEALTTSTFSSSSELLSSDESYSFVFGGSIKACLKHLEQHGLTNELENLAHAIIEEAIKRTKRTESSPTSNEFELGRFTSRNACRRIAFKKLTAKRATNTDAITKSREDFVHCKA